MTRTKKMLGVMAGAIALAAVPTSAAHAARIQVDIIGVEIVVDVCVTVSGVTYCQVVPID